MDTIWKQRRHFAQQTRYSDSIGRQRHSQADTVACNGE
ncbi:hypothetical protein EGR_11286 [Echinococcus granulosus]|uniref:Uncharacterized protein n=1 Tax=Echinococcus granulosus TaxID=6210 RepID=W6TYR1_ECHGR|nr:hypothetical protein EGR_11286 [Echinococcus granulosus]EUB53863.1 hypothetical protein EGR_11286 [Echinococcus granulosus]